jgi:hypothetical protein
VFQVLRLRIMVAIPPTPLKNNQPAPTKATPELGKMFIGFKVNDAVNQLHQLLAAQKN